MVFPRNGSYMELSSYWSDTLWASDYDYAALHADIRGYRSIFDETILAGRALIAYGGGNVPLHRMVELGGLYVLRGYLYSRFRGRCGYALQSELRFPLYRRLRGAVFVAAGQVGDGIGELALSRTKYSGGVGLRIRPNAESDVQIRLDFGLSPDSYGIYITLMEAF